MITEREVRITAASTLSDQSETGPAIMHYDSEDPFALTLIFPGQNWSFAKSILFDAITHVGTQGVGDVQILDDDTETGTFIVFLSSPDGVAAIKIPTDDVIEFADEIREIDLAGGTDNAVSDALEIFLSGLMITEE